MGIELLLIGEDIKGLVLKEVNYEIPSLNILDNVVDIEIQSITVFNQKVIMLDKLSNGFKAKIDYDIICKDIKDIDSKVKVINDSLVIDSLREISLLLESKLCFEICNAGNLTNIDNIDNIDNIKLKVCN